MLYFLYYNYVAIIDNRIRCKAFRIADGILCDGILALCLFEMNEN